MDSANNNNIIYSKKKLKIYKKNKFLKKSN